MPHPIPLDRRQLLLCATAATTSLWLPRSAWSQARPSDNPFALGVASGSPTHQGVVLWTRLAAGSVPPTQDATVRWEVAHDAQFQRVVHSGQSTAPALLGHAVHVELQGLAPDRWYHYRFMWGDAVSPTGRTRTFPAPGTPAARLRLAYASCQHWEHGYYSAYRHMRQEQLDAVVFLGDYIYEYGGSSKAVRSVSSSAVISLDDYRARYALYKSDPDLQAMHAACPWLMTWDDHEVQNDYAGTTAGSKGPAVANFLARRAAAYQAFYEHMPVRASVLTQALGGLARGAEMRIYGQVPFGTLATLYLLDDRQYRDPQACTKDGAPGSSTVNPAQCAIWSDAQRTLLGDAQERWVDQAFAKSAGTWNVVGQQTVFGQRDFKLGQGQSLSNDGWDGYGPARSRFTTSLQRHSVRNPVLLGGDVHANWVGHVKADYAQDRSATVGVEFCGTSITSYGGNNDKLAEQLTENPHFVFADRERRGYGVAEFTPTQLTTTLRAVQDPSLASSGIDTLAQFVVQAGQARIERV
ncbi:alkaline phosphatase D family protein [Rhodoferax aquaticus]|uniref:Alkaline phosphatase n=1 Tax=Rhodoferax aquaticus TaxID=2527691 RepID=A0A515ESP2_9BURK|nr:alkaline phosphatase D family protein [Rhodoferax aquaticus]QDL55648.1 alkaline phosphatase [Rhodoferax aquaticus]